jgi:rhodanese-related sulfurtransferase
MAAVGEISTSDLKKRLDCADAPAILDVREAGEVATAPFPRAMHIPMGDIPARLGELDPEAEIVVVCHHGIRSAQVAGYLAAAGFQRVMNLAGGIDAWSRTVDPTVARY